MANLNTIVGLLFSLLTLAASAAPLMQQGFESRLGIREQFSAQESDLIKQRMVQMREQEEIKGEQLIGIKAREIEEKSPTLFTETDGAVLNLNPKFSNFELKSGDVILVRGRSIISTTIATLSDSPSEFSHLLMVYQNPRTREYLALEALVDQGVIVHPLSEVLNEGIARAVVYRHPDARLAEKAAELGVDLALTATKQGKNFPYDFKLNMNEYSSVYCAELIRMLFDIASGGQVLMPTFPSTVGQKLRQTQLSLGMSDKTLLVFAPSDVDLEQQFDLVAEWRDLRATLNYRIKDQIMLKLFEWIEKGALYVDYSKMMKTMNPPSASGDSSDAGLNLDPQKLKVLSEKADQVVMSVARKILKANEGFVQQNGRNMSGAEIQALLEKQRSSLSLSAILEKNGFVKTKPALCGAVVN